VTELAINARIAAVITVHQRDAFAEYSNDAFNLVLGSDDDSGEE
jgi:hypothetical protein